MEPRTMPILDYDRNFSRQLASLLVENDIRLRHYGDINHVELYTELNIHNKFIYIIYSTTPMRPYIDDIINNIDNNDEINGNTENLIKAENVYFLNTGVGKNKASIRNFEERVIRFIENLKVNGKPDYSLLEPCYPEALLARELADAAGIDIADNNNLCSAAKQEYETLKPVNGPTWDTAKDDAEILHRLICQSDPA